MTSSTSAPLTPLRGSGGRTWAPVVHRSTPLRDRIAAERYGIPPTRVPEWTKRLTAHPCQPMSSAGTPIPALDSPLVCRHKIVPSQWFVGYLQHVTPPIVSHYPSPFTVAESSSLSRAPGIPLSGALLRSEDLATPGGSAVVPGRRAQPVHS